MDFIVSYHLYNKLKKQELNELNNNLISKNIKVLQKDNQKTKQYKSVFKTCERCGQDPYLCQCEKNLKAIYINFNPEKDKY